MLGSNVLEVAMGLIFVYLFLSLICSTINEQVFARLFTLRARTLEEGILAMLDDTNGAQMVQDFYNHALIKGLARQGPLGKRFNLGGKPSYIPSPIFALVIKDVITSYKLAEVPQSLKTVLEQAQGETQQELANLERWFDDTMDRVSGWYKRKVQLILFVLALVIVVYLNVDTISLMTALLSNSVLHDSIVSAAQGTGKDILNPAQNLPQLEHLQQNFALIQPGLGWKSPLPSNFSEWSLKIIGLLATTFAVSLGAPFWFDLLNKFTQLRMAGNPPPRATSTTVPPSTPFVSPTENLEANKTGNLLIPSAISVEQKVGPALESTLSVEQISGVPVQAAAHVVSPTTLSVQVSTTTSPPSLLTVDHYVNLKNGVFDGTTKANLDHLFTNLAASSPNNENLVLHFHGGLVDVQAAEKTAESLLKRYHDLAAYQVFFLWESGFLDILTQQLQTIIQDSAFNRLIMFITHFMGNQPRNTAPSASEMTQFHEALMASNVLQVGVPHTEAFLFPDLTGVTEIVLRVRERFVQHRDHGMYATVVEEVLRQYYLDKVGKGIWDSIKQAIVNAFGDDESKYGGTAFLKGLADYWAQNNHSRITLVGHSAGAIYVCHLLQKALEVLPEEIKFDIVFLAPACTFQLFSDTLKTCQGRIAGLRIFGMRDAVEQADALLSQAPFVYPYSLLYFLSGVLENEADTPLLGMQRYHTTAAPYGTLNGVLESLNYLNTLGADSTIWSIINEGVGLACSTRSHGGFYDDGPIADSLRHIIENGL